MQCFVSFRYLITADQECTDFASTKDFPPSLGDDGRIGELAGDGGGGLCAVSHTTPLITASDSGQVSIEMTCDTEVRVTPEFLGPCGRDKKQISLQQYVFTEAEGRTLRYRIIY